MPLDFEFMLRIFPALLHALGITIQISFLSLIFGIILGILLGSLRVIGPRFIQIPIQWLVNYIRGTPQLVQFLIVYFALPRIGIVLSEFWTGVVALTVIAAGYEVEIVRAAIESIDKGQKEAALALGMSDVKVLWLVLLPQATKRMIPALTNELSNVIKASSLLSVIAVNELTKVGNKTIYETFYFFEVLIEVALLYLVVIGSLGWVSNYLENKVFTYREKVAATEVR